MVLWCLGDGCIIIPRLSIGSFSLFMSIFVIFYLVLLIDFKSNIDLMLGNFLC
jgi:hypothetical protein